MEKNELKKELMKAKTMAEFTHYCAGSLYYRVETQDGKFQFPIATVEKIWGRMDGPMDAVAEIDAILSGHAETDLRLSPDLGTTAFPAREKASMLWRWIDKAIDAGEFLKVE